MRLGIDVVDLAGIRNDVDRWGALFTRRIMTPREERWASEAGRPYRRIAACLAVKESVIKVLGGRPVPFKWQDIELRPWECVSIPPPEIRVAAGELARSAGVRTMAYHPCSLQGTSLSRAAERLGSRKERCPGHVWAAWGCTSERTIALALMW